MTRRTFALGFAALAGALFGVGLIVSGMTLPSRVIGFLDVRDWDPTLAFVMAGAIAVYAPAYRVLAGKSPWFDTQCHLPAQRAIDRSLVLGAAIFGVGWGLAGWCPGPALVAMTSSVHAIVFVAMMIAGMQIGWRIRTN